MGNNDHLFEDNRRTKCLDKQALEDLRRRVDGKRIQEARVRMQEELLGLNVPLDPNAVYLSSSELADKVGTTPETVTRHIRTQKLRGRKANRLRGATRPKAKWFIHPEDAREWARKYFMKELDL